jgi:hypothetical protein
MGKSEGRDLVGDRELTEPKPGIGTEEGERAGEGKREEDVERTEEIVE